MFRRNLWKITISVIIVAWALLTLLPIQDRPFVEYAKAQATAKPAEFNALLAEATALKTSGESMSEFVALKQLARTRKIDLTQYFPGIKLEESLKNLEKRNDILLNELLRRSKSRLQLGLDLKGGVAFTLEVDPEAAAKFSDRDREEKLAKAIEIISARVNAFGVAEPIIRPVGDNRIEVQLPNINTRDNPEVVDNVKKPARLDFRVVHPTQSPLNTPPDEIPAGYEIMTLENQGRSGEVSVEELFVKRRPEMSGEGIQTSFVRTDAYGKPEIAMMFTPDGRKRFAQVTRNIVQEAQAAGTIGRLAIVLDGKLYSAPTVREEIDSESAQISGSLTDREAFDLANVLNNPLDLPLVVKEQYEVGPSLASDSVVSAQKAFIISSILTIGFIVAFYTIGGFVAAIGMAVNVLITLGIMASFGATLTMPGIAGIVLTLAMSVDANILIFERMREERMLGKSLTAALEAGYEKAWSAIFDSNVTTFLVAIIMYMLGTGPVKGFGLTLAIGVGSTMFAAIVVSRILLDAVIPTGAIKNLKMFSVLNKTKFDFLRYAKPAFIVSWLLVLAGVATVAYKGKDIYGIDFAGGDMVTLTSDARLDIGALRTAAQQAGVHEATFAYQKSLSSDRETLQATVPFDEGDKLVDGLQTAFPQANIQLAGQSRIGPSVGEEIQWNALQAVFWSLVLITGYVAFRFEFGYGMGAVISTIHDLLITIGIFVMLGREFNAPMVAAILLIAGYSINDTIVVFDRIREELKLNPTTSLRDIINRSLNLTLSRTVITGGTTLLTAITLIVVTTGDVNDIAVTLLIGVITGTFSSLFIAAPVFYWWHKGDRKHVEAHSDVMPKYEWTGSSKASH